MTAPDWDAGGLPLTVEWRLVASRRVAGRRGQPAPDAIEWRLNGGREVIEWRAGGREWRLRPAGRNEVTR